ncbi:MAG: type II toxin-antitoxin system RelE/ParE family toxin [Candidatus Woesearchaeota archaeon]
MFSVEFSNKSKKFLKKCDSGLCKRILDKISLLKESPVLHDSKKVINEERTFRVRVGDYRILYKVKWEYEAVIIGRIDKRPRVYHR